MDNWSIFPNAGVTEFLSVVQTPSKGVNCDKRSLMKQADYGKKGNRGAAAVLQQAFIAIRVVNPWLLQQM